MAVMDEKELYTILGTLENLRVIQTTGKVNDISTGGSYTSTSSGVERFDDGLGEDAAGTCRLLEKVNALLNQCLLSYLKNAD